MDKFTVSITNQAYPESVNLIPLAGSVVYSTNNVMQADCAHARFIKTNVNRVITLIHNGSIRRETRPVQMNTVVTYP